MAEVPTAINLTADVVATALDGVMPGQEFSVWIPAGGTISGTLEIQGEGEGADKQTIPGGAFTAVDAHKVFVNPSANGKLYYKLTGSTTPDFDLVVVPILGERGS